MSKYDKLKDQQKNLHQVEQTQYDLASSGMGELTDDSRSTVQLYENVDSVLADIDQRFYAASKLDDTDTKFLMLATALQIGRWIILAEISKALDEKIKNSRIEHNDKSILSMEKEKRKDFQASIERHFGDEHFKGTGHRDWTNIVFDSVPYDITRGSPLFGVNMQGGLHRIHTLGHDPILGWLFGTVNILSDTITLDKTYACRTFNVEMINKPKRWTSETSFVQAFAKAVDSIREDKKRLPAGVFAQALHLESDVFTKLGLPVPVLEAFSTEFAGKLYENGYDTLCLMKDIAVYGVQAVVSVLINMLITLIHGLFYNPEKHSSRDLYEVKTRKILDYSNLIASSSNVITVAGMSIAAFATKNADLGKKAMSTLDVGGIIVTIYRLITDTKFIRQIKEEFLEKEWYNAVVGDPYQFVAEVERMGKKDVQKGIEIQAKADAAKAAKLADGLEAHSRLLDGIKVTQGYVRNAVDTVIQDQAEQEAEFLYGLKTTKRISDLDPTEQRVLGAVLFTILANDEQPSDLQKKFYQCVEQCGIQERVTDFQFANLSNIDSYSDRRVILKAICAFLFLGKCNSDFMNDEKYSWLSEFTSKADVDRACREIETEFTILGGELFVSGYLPPVVTETLPAEEVPAAEIEETCVEDEFDYSRLFEVIRTHTANEGAFGKAVNPTQAFLDKELGKDHPDIAESAAIIATRISNGYLLFTTYALYLRTGNMLRGEYVCLPYKKILTDKISTGDGKVKGTRKLIIPYLSEDGQRTVELDDTKVEEEKLRTLLLEIKGLNRYYASTDKQIKFEELSKCVLADYLTILASILNKNGHSMVEIYLLANDYGVTDDWASIVDFISEEYVGEWIDDFINRIPYPSEISTTTEGMKICLRTLCRTNIIEGSEATLLTQFEEKCAKQFDMVGMMSDADFSITLKQCSKDPRKLSLLYLIELRETLGTISYADQIAEYLDAMIQQMRAEEDAKQNTPAAKFVRAVQDGAVPVAKEMAKRFRINKGKDTTQD